jgi:hypothetical protein
MTHLIDKNSDKPRYITDDSEDAPHEDDPPWWIAALFIVMAVAIIALIAASLWHSGAWMWELLRAAGDGPVG